jgi:hypothetical protein
MFFSRAKSGDTLVLKCGKYEQSIIWTLSGVTVKGDGEFASRGANGCASIASSEGPAAVQFLPGIENVRLANIDITDSAAGASCVTFDTDGSKTPSIYSKNIDVEFNTIHGCAANGVDSVWNAHITISNNVVYDNAGGKDDTYCNSGISVLQPVDDGKTSGAYSVIIENNLGYGNVDNATCQRGAHSDGEFIIIDGSPSPGCSAGLGGKKPTFNTCLTTARALIEGNYGSGNGGAGIEVFNDNNADILYNVLSKDELSHLDWHEGEIAIIGNSDLIVSGFNVEGNTTTEDESVVPSVSCSYAKDLTVSANVNEGPGVSLDEASTCKASYQK